MAHRLLDVGKRRSLGGQEHSGDTGHSQLQSGCARASIRTGFGQQQLRLCAWHRQGPNFANKISFAQILLID